MDGCIDSLKRHVQHSIISIITFIFHMKNRWILFVLYWFLGSLGWSAAYALEMKDNHRLNTQQTVHLIEKYLQPEVRIEKLAQQPLQFSTSSLGPWLEQHTMMTAEQIQQQHKVLGTLSQRLIASQDDLIYASARGLAVGEHYAIYHPMHVYKDHSKAALEMKSTEVTEVARAVVERLSPDIATLRIEAGGRYEVRRGDVIMQPIKPDLATIIELKQPSHPLLSGGQVVYLHNATTLAGGQDVVTIDRGAVQGAEIGQLFDIVESSSQTLAPKLSHANNFALHRIGQLIIIRVFDQRSYAYILASSQAVRMGYFLKPAVLSK